MSEQAGYGGFCSRSIYTKRLYAIELSKTEWITLVSCIAASISAIFAAISAFLLWRQSRAKYKLKLAKCKNTKNPQNIFNQELKFATVRVILQNISSHTVFLSDCYLEVNKTKYWALQSGTDFKFTPIIKLKTDYNANIALNEDGHGSGFLTTPIELKPHEHIDKFLLFPEFITNTTKPLKAKLVVCSLDCFNKKRAIVLYHQGYTGT